MGGGAGCLGVLLGRGQAAGGDGARHIVAVDALVVLCGGVYCDWSRWGRGNFLRRLTLEVGFSFGGGGGGGGRRLLVRKVW